MIEMPPGQGFAAGTSVATATGRRNVEQLAIGDEILDAAGNPRRISWVGRIALAAAHLEARPESAPVRVRAGALGDGLPRRDLLVAPQTELGVILPNGDAATVSAALLRNEITLLRATMPHGAELYEIELADGGGVLAEDVPAGLLLPNHASASQRVATVRARAWVSARAGCLPGPLLGRLDAAEHGLFYGWAMDEQRPWMRVGLEILVNGRVLTAMMAGQRRDDLVRAGIGDGHCAFHFEPLPPLPADRTLLVQVRRADDGVDLPGSPVLLDKAGGAAQILEALSPSGPEQAAEMRAVLRRGLNKLQAP